MVHFISHFPTPSLDYFTGGKDKSPDPSPNLRSRWLPELPPLLHTAPRVLLLSHPQRAVCRTVGTDILKLGRPSAVFSLVQNLCFWLAATVNCV